MVSFFLEYKFELINRNKMTPVELAAYRATHNNADPPWERMTDKVFGRAKDLIAPYFLCGTLKGRSFFSHVDVIMDGASHLNP